MDEKDFCLEAERAEKKTVVGAAKPFGRPPILCSAEVALTAYIGAGGGVKWGRNHQIGGGGEVPWSPTVPPDTHQTPIKTPMHLINSSNLALAANAMPKYIREPTIFGALPPKYSGSCRFFSARTED